jgi:hypothetical protein
MSALSLTHRWRMWRYARRAYRMQMLQWPRPKSDLQLVREWKIFRERYGILYVKEH